MGGVRAVKGRDERPTGALDSPSDPEKIRVSNLLLDKADDFIDGRLFSAIRRLATKRASKNISPVKSARRHVSAGREYDPIGSLIRCLSVYLSSSSHISEKPIWGIFLFTVAQSPVCS
jgi:hypothetical protein